MAASLPKSTTFLGIAGPGVKSMGVTKAIFTDHTDIRPTLLSLVGLKDDYGSQGRTVAEVIQDWARPEGIGRSEDTFMQLATAYKLINAPTGRVGLAILRVSTRALKGDAETYAKLEAKIAAVTALRNSIADQMADKLNAAEFHGHRIRESHAETLIAAAGSLIDYISELNDD